MGQINWIAFTAIGTWILALTSFFMMYFQHRIALRDLRVKHQVYFSEKWDSKQMKVERKKAANQFLSPNISHQDMQESIPDFFEGIGNLWDKKYLDENLIWSDFGYYIERWWLVYKEYIIDDRKRSHNDNTLYMYFEKLEQHIKKIDTKIRKLKIIEILSENERVQFLNDEAALK